MKRRFTLLLLALPMIGSAQCFDTGDGSDGGFHATVDTSIVGGIYNYSSFEIDAGVTVSVTGASPLEIHVTGTSTINGTLTVQGGNGADGVTFSTFGVGGTGVAGGGNGGDGVYLGSAAPGVAGSGPGGGGEGLGWSGGGGGGHSAVGGSSGGTGGFGGAMYGDADISTMEAGSGGGGGSGGNSCGSGGGGAGGGLIVLNTETLVISATGIITADGGAGGSDGTGNCGGGGGGSGGAVIIASNSITNDGSVTAVGGAGGNSTLVGSPYWGVGAAGADGRIRVDGPYSGGGTLSPAAGTMNPAVIGPSVDSVSVSICDGDSITVLTSVYDSSGVYNDTIPGGAANGCDSIIVTTLSVEVLDMTITTAGALFTSNQATGSWQWITCADSAAISGETNQTFTAPSNGDYAVIVTVGGCTDTSACETFNQTGLGEWNLNSFEVYPNPTSGQFSISFDAGSDVEQIRVTDLVGKVVYQTQTINSQIIDIDLSDFEDGVYIIDVRVNEQNETLKIVKK